MFHSLISQFWPSTVDGLAAGAIYALLALGYTMVYGVLRLINFAHSEVFMVGAFTSLFALQKLGINHPATGLTLVLFLSIAVVAAMVGSGVTAVVLERVAYRPLRTGPWPGLGRRIVDATSRVPHRPGLRSAKVMMGSAGRILQGRGGGSSRLAALISAIGASIFLQELFGVWVIPQVFDRPQHGKDQLAYEHLMDKHPWFHIGSAGVRDDKLIVFVAAIVMMIVLDVFVNRTKVGRGIRATAQDPETAVLMGVNIERIIVTTFLVGGLMAGIAAALYSFEFENLRYNMGFIPGIKAFTAAVMGGIGNLRGALVGGLVLGLIEAYGASMFGSAWKDVIAFVILVLVLMFRPTGILGESLQQAKA